MTTTAKELLLDRARLLIQRAQQCETFKSDIWRKYESFLVDSLFVEADSPTFAYSPDSSPLPCPFCGQEPKIGEHMSSDESGERYGYFFIECHHSPNAPVVAHGDTREDCLKLWNMRASPEIKPTEAYSLAMYLTRNNQQHTFTAEELQAGIEQFMRERR